MTSTLSSYPSYYALKKLKDRVLNINLTLMQKSPILYYATSLCFERYVSGKDAVERAMTHLKQGQLYMTFNVDWGSKLTDLQLFAVVCHEALHVLGRHLDLRQKPLKFHNLMNYCEDAAINCVIPNLPADCIFVKTIAEKFSIDNLEENQCAEYYFDMVMAHLPHCPEHNPCQEECCIKDKERAEQGNDEAKGKGTAQEKNSDSLPQESKEQEDSAGSAGEQKKEESSLSSNCTCPIKELKPFDAPPDVEDSELSEAAKQALSEIMSEYTKDQLKKIWELSEHSEGRIKYDAKAYDGDKSSFPNSPTQTETPGNGGPGEVLQSIIFPSRRVCTDGLLALIKKLAGQRRDVTKSFTRRKPNRRYGWAFPGTKKSQRRKHVLCYLDWSGSVSDEMLSNFFSRVDEIVDIADVDIVGFDTQLFQVIKYTPRQYIKVLGRGGTDFHIVFNDWHRNQYKYDSMLLFTDGGASAPPEPTNLRKVIWVLYPGCKAPVTWGTQLNMEIINTSNRKRSYLNE